MDRNKSTAHQYYPAAKIAFIYAAVGVAWVFLSDQLLLYVISDEETLSQLQAVKGLIYIVITAALLFWLIQRQLFVLKERENFSRNIFESSSVGMAVCRLNGELVFANPAYARTIGRSVEETLQLSFWDFTPEEYVAGEQRNITGLKTKGRYGPYEKEYIHKDGHRVPVRLQGILLEMGGEPLTWSFVEDISERRAAETSIRDNAERLADAQRMARIGSWELDLLTKQLKWSDEVYRIFDIDPRAAGLSYETFLKAIHPDDREQVSNAYNASLANKEPYRIEHRLRLPDGTIKYVQERCETLYGNDGNSLRSVGTVQDITERHLAEQSLKRVNRALQALSACNEALVRTQDEDQLLNRICRIIVDTAGYRLAWVGLAENDEAKTLRPVAQAGYEEGYLEGVKLSWDDTERGRGPGGIAVRNGQPCIINDVQMDDRFTLWREQAVARGYASVAALPLIDDKHTFGVLIIYAAEVNVFAGDEFQLLEQMASDLAYGIGSLRSHRERDRLNQQLQQAQKMQAIGQLTGGIAHDFNNILASMMGFTSLALKRFVKDDQPELREYLNEVALSGERARDLVAQLLAFSRTADDQGKASPILLPPMVEEVVRMLQSTLPSSIQLSSHLDADLPAVMMDPVHFQQVLMNLCINARDAIEGNGRIDIRCRGVQIVDRDRHTGHNGTVLHNNCGTCHRAIEPGGYVELTVQDSGTGINAENLKRIFDPFFTTKDVGKGSGMGLPMVHGLVHQHSGHILVEPNSGSGAQFRLLLPVGSIEPLSEADIDVKQRPSAEGLRGARILVVDDEESIGRLIKDLLEGEGGDVTMMNDSPSALVLFRQQPSAFDLVITDQTMPKMTGVELAQQLWILRPETPVILCTGFSEDVDEARAKALGFSGYLSKPMQVDALSDSVVQALQ